VTAPDAGAMERFASVGATRTASSLTRPATMLTWQGVATPRLESVRLLLSENRLRASGRLIAAAGDGESYSASFEVSADDSGAISRLLLRSTTADEERQVSLSRTEDSVWLVDHGHGAERDEFAGATEVDVSGAVLFNSLPIRRLGLHTGTGAHELPVVFVNLPDLSVQLTRQSYQTVSTNDDGAVVRHTDGDSVAELTVDTEGFVVDYPGLARRV
jgi:hypothetical protein